MQVDVFGTRDAFLVNAEKEFERNRERYEFLRWGQTAFDNFKVVPPDTGIVHQVNLEYLARVVFVNDRDGTAYPDTLVGTDSHTTMINGLGVLGWGVGGIEAEAAMLGQPMSMLIPQVIGFKLHGELPEGATATDLVLTVTEMLREKGVVGKFVEFYGAGVVAPAAGRPRDDRQHEPGVRLDLRDLPDRRRDAALPGVLRPRARAGRSSSRPTRRRRASGTTRTARSRRTPTRSSSTSATVVPSLAGPKRPQDRVSLTRRQGGVPGRARRSTSPKLGDELDDEVNGIVPGVRPARDDGSPGTTRRPRAAARYRRPVVDRVDDAVDVTMEDGTVDDARPRPRRDRGDHVVHEHVEPVGDGRRRPARAQGGARRA